MLLTNTCRMCGRELVGGERMLCLHCLGDAPVWAGSTDDLRTHRFPRALPVDGVWPWLLYTNPNPMCALIRRGKFNDRPDLIEGLARIYAAWLVRNGYLAGIDVIIPVPMHWWKRLRRGYNQSDLIAAEIARAGNIHMVKALKAVRSHSVQSRKSGVQRADNVRGIFELRKNHGIAPGSRVAIVDDILTTGATLSEAMNALSPASPSGIVVLTLAATAL